MLAKMGWKGGDNGLGKNQQGTSTNLRAVRRAESLGIGAENDAFGDKGWQDTNAGFHGVLASLKREYSTGGSDEDGVAKKKRKKEEKKRKKKEEKRRAKNGSGSSSSDGCKDGVRLPQNKVLAGHARKVREAKDIRNKSSADMAAIFGVKADFYKQPRDWGVVTSDDSKNVNDSSDGLGEKKKKKSKNKSSKELRVNTDFDDKSKKDKKKRKRSSEGSDSDDQKKSKKEKKSKK